MAADIKGTAVIWSVGGIAFTFGIVSGTHPSLKQSYRQSRSVESTKIKDNGGDIKTIVIHGAAKQASITVVPSSTTIALAVASKIAHMVQPGTKITIQDNATTPATTENWIALGSTENRTVDGVTTIDIELENGDTDLSTSAA